MRQEQALYVMSQGRSVFLTGPAGSGKTYVLNQFIRQQKKLGKEVAVTASTGIAATHLGGSTIHSWSGLGIRDSLTTDNDRSWLENNSKLAKRYNLTDILIIDEVSMLHGTRLDMVNEVCKLLRGSDKPFGGLQVILCGDLFQLPPVNRTGGREDFVHTSDAWQELEPTICYLGTQFRQRDGVLLGILESLRADIFDEVQEELLRERIGLQPDPDTVVTRLYTHNINVDEINRKHLDQIDSQVEIYEMSHTGRAQSVEQLQKSVLAPAELGLKKGAEVMFVANNPAAGYANGTRGRVVTFKNGMPLVELPTGRIINVETHTWRLEEDGRERASVSQLPIRLAWAITIHKSQGMSLDAAQIDLSKAFAYGMGYVAMSRVRSIDGLYLLGINPMALKLHPEIFVFDKQIRLLSSNLAEKIGEVSVKEPVEKTPQIDNKLLVHLRDWRAKRASADSVPAYIIAHDKALHDIALRIPKSERQLLAINGFGQKKLQTYGPDILRITNQYG